MIEFRIERHGGVPTHHQVVRRPEHALLLDVLVPGDRRPTAREAVAAHPELRGERPSVPPGAPPAGAGPRGTPASA